jgi:tetratricopeptide (TPR) repeat protein
MGAPAILPTAHSHHAEGSLGNRCVECHMPQTQYMQSDWRRDHGFHSPDPLLTEELGIPNACARCHEDQTVAWAVEKTEAWYGEALENKGYRERTRTVAAARAQTPGTGKALITTFQKETNAIWRASLVRLMEPFLREPGVTDVVETALQDPEAQVRAAAVQTLRMLPGSEQRLLALREDPVREVRLNAVWATLEAPGMRPGNKAELEAWLNFNSDDVVGRLNQAQAAWRRGQVDQMQQWLSRMRELDDSAGPNMMAGRMLYAAGLPEEAGSRFERAVEADPENVEAWFVLGMLRGEGRRIDDAIEAFRRAVLLDPAFGRAWYNLGLAQVQTGDEQAGLLSLRRAEATQPGSADAAYAAATVHARAGRLDEAVAALQRGLLQQPSHGPSLQLLRQLGR